MGGCTISSSLTPAAGRSGQRPPSDVPCREAVHAIKSRAACQVGLKHQWDVPARVLFPLFDVG